VVEEVESAIGETQKVLEQLDIQTNPLVEPSLSGETSPSPYNVLFGDMVDEEGNANNETETFEFPILDITRDISMKNILLSSLPHFHGMSTEDPDSFLFEFDILCMSYNYTDSAQKLKLFPTTSNSLSSTDTSETTSTTLETRMEKPCAWECSFSNTNSSYL
jgi:hypothetical protein